MRQRIGFFYLAAQNLRRRPGRSALSAAGVVVAAATAFAGLVGLMGIQRSAQLGLERLGADMLVVPSGHTGDVHEALIAGRPAGFYMEDGVLEAIRTIAGVTALSPQVFVPGPRPEDPPLIGFDPATDFTVLPWLEARLPHPPGDHEVIVGHDTGYVVGGRVQLYGEDFRVVGRLLRTGAGVDRMLFMTRPALYGLAARAREAGLGGPVAKVQPRAISAVLLRVEEWMPPDIFVTQIKAKAPVADVVRRGEVAREVAQVYVRSVRWMLTVVAVLLGIGLVMIGVLFSAIVSERQRELGLLRAMGGSAWNILALILTEAVILTTVSGGLGTVLGTGLLLAAGRWVEQGLQVPYLWPPAPVTAAIALGTVLMAAVMGLASAAYPAARAALMEPYEAIRSGE